MYGAHLDTSFKEEHRSVLEKIEYSSFGSNIKCITFDKISEIEKALDNYDLISIVFLLYKIPETALESLSVLERCDIKKDISLLTNWARKVQGYAAWRYEFLEALTVCQLYCLIRDLGFEVKSVKKFYQPDNMQFNVHLNIVKKGLYKLCENITTINFQTMKKILKNYKFFVEYENCELIILELMVRKFISVGDSRNAHASPIQIENLIKIVENLEGLQVLAKELTIIQKRFTNLSDKSFFECTRNTNSFCADDELNKSFEKLTPKDFNDVYTLINKVNEEEKLTMFKTDTKKENSHNNEAYTIHNPRRLGICCIINEKDFYPSSNSIEQNECFLEKRRGTNKDVFALEQTMSSLNFEIASSSNLTREGLYKFIKNVIEFSVDDKDSVFVLVIMSHGVKEYVYASDSIKVKIDDLKEFTELAFQRRKLNGVPKVLIIQACQDNDSGSRWMADSFPDVDFVPKSDFLTFYATAPELKAYRCEKEGSIFIQTLCDVLIKKADREHLCDIFTEVIKNVAKICSMLNRQQLPTFTSTLRHKLFLKLPVD